MQLELNETSKLVNAKQQTEEKANTQDESNVSPKQKKLKRKRELYFLINITAQQLKKLLNT